MKSEDALSAPLLVFDNTVLNNNNDSQPDQSNPYDPTSTIPTTSDEAFQPPSHGHVPTLSTKFTTPFLIAFLPASYYILYILLTSMQELPMTSIAWLLNNVTKFSPAELTIYYNLCFLPWTIKPLWGFIADNVPICGYRRKPYLIFFSLLATAVFILMPFYATDKLFMRILGVLQAWCVVFCEVQVDGLVMTLSNGLLLYQSKLYQKFPEFKLYMKYKQKLSLIQRVNDKLVTKRVAQVVGIGGDPHASDDEEENEKTELLTTTPTQRLAKNETNGITINSTQSLVSADADDANTDKKTSKPQTEEELAEKYIYTTPESVFQAQPHYYDILNSIEYHIMLTALPKASIQSEAMTIRTTASLGSSLISLLLHLWLPPKKVVWVCAALPLMLLTVILTIPEKSDSILDKLKVRMKELRGIASLNRPKQAIVSQTGESVDDTNGKYIITHSSSSPQQPNNQPPTDTISTSSSNSSIFDDSDDAGDIDSDDDSKGNKGQSGRPQGMSCCSYFWNRVVACLHAIVILWKPLLFMLVMRIMPTAIDPLMSYVFGYLKLPPWLLSGYSFISVGGGLLATLVYWKWFTTIRLIPSFIVFTILSILATIPTIAMTSNWFPHLPVWALVFATTFIGAIFGRFSLMPTLILAAETTPRELGLEATMFSIYTAMNNIGNVLSVAGSLWLVHKFHITYEDFAGLPKMLIVCGLCSLVPLLFLPLLCCAKRDVKRLDKWYVKQQKLEKQRLKALALEAEAAAAAANQNNNQSVTTTIII